MTLDASIIDYMVKEQDDANPVDIEHYRAVMEAGTNALKTAMLVNGGAATATLALLSALTGEGRTIGIGWIVVGLILFSFGLSLTVAASGCHYRSLVTGRRMRFGSYDPGPRHKKAGNIWRRLGMFLFLGSGATFLTGALCVAAGLLP